MERVLILVQRDAPALLEYVQASFSPLALDVTIVEDRRLAERRRHDLLPPRERRRLQRRRHDVGPGLARWGWAVVRLRPDEPEPVAERRCAVCGEPIVPGQGRRRDVQGDFHIECWERRHRPGPDREP